MLLNVGRRLFGLIVENTIRMGVAHARMFVTKIQNKHKACKEEQTMFIVHGTVHRFRLRIPIQLSLVIQGNITQL